MGVKTTKGSRSRVSDHKAYRDNSVWEEWERKKKERELMHEKDPEKKAELIDLWHREIWGDGWEESRKNNPHLWGDSDDKKTFHNS